MSTGQKTSLGDLTRVLVTDCGSTTTKALLFELTEAGWRQTYRGEAPTTVEKPVEDVTVGALNAFREVQEISGLPLIEEVERSGASAPFILKGGRGPREPGIDLYLSTSSAGGGLQMMVTGVVKEITTESAQRAALGAGAIVLDAISADDGREDHERIERIRHLKPDIVLLTGGVDNGAQINVIEMAELLLAAAPRPRFGDTLRLPVIYAGNASVAEEVRNILSSIGDISIVSNIRPAIDVENLNPAREAIHEFFLTHVMSHSPGYGKLLSWSPVPVMPTPAAVGDIVVEFSRSTGQSVLCADIGGATTDVFSVFKNLEGVPVFNRTVSANLGMSYSMANVLVEAGPAKIKRWLPYRISDSELRDRMRNKMIRPTSIPQTLEDLWLEQAVCREALRLSLQHHRSLAVGLSGVQRNQGIADLFSQRENRYQLADLMKLDVVIGSGGVLSHAPERIQAALMMIDGFELEGLTQITVDSIFMMPHLGVLASVHPDAAKQIFTKDCLVSIAHSVVPVLRGRAKLAPGTELLAVHIDGREVARVKAGDLQRVDVEVGKRIELKLNPLRSDIDIGAGSGKSFDAVVVAGQCGLILDGRGRPLSSAGDDSRDVERQQRHFENLGLLNKRGGEA